MRVAPSRGISLSIGLGLLALTATACGGGGGGGSGRALGAAAGGARTSPPGAASSAPRVLPQARARHTATVLASGELLIAGGVDAAGGPLATTVVIDGNGALRAGPSLSSPRVGHSATLLASGAVLIAGGTADAAGQQVLDATDVITVNPTAGGVTLPGPTLGQRRSEHVAAAVATASGGELVFIGAGWNVDANGQPRFVLGGELLNVDAGSSAPLGATLAERVAGAAVVLPNDQILIVGGDGATGPTSAAELVDVVAGTATPVAGIAARSGAAVVGRGDEVLVAGGESAAGIDASTEIFDAPTSTFFQGVTLARARRDATATIVGTRIAIVGGWDGRGPVGETEVLDGDPISVAVLGAGPALKTPRFGHTATALPSGDIVVAGGFDAAGAVLDSIEVLTLAPSARPSTPAPSSAAGGTPAPIPGASTPSIPNPGSGLASAPTPTPATPPATPSPAGPASTPTATAPTAPTPSSSAPTPTPTGSTPSSSGGAASSNPLAGILAGLRGGSGGGGSSAGSNPLAGLAGGLGGAGTAGGGNPLASILAALGGSGGNPFTAVLNALLGGGGGSNPLAALLGGAASPGGAGGNPLAGLLAGLGGSGSGSGGGSGSAAGSGGGSNPLSSLIAALTSGGANPLPAGLGGALGGSSSGSGGNPLSGILGGAAGGGSTGSNPLSGLLGGAGSPTGSTGSTGSSSAPGGGTTPTGGTGGGSAPAGSAPGGGTITSHNPAGPALPLLDDVQLYINLGASVAAGANAPSGQGYHALVFRNHASRPSYTGESIVDRWPSARLIQQGNGGAESTEVVNDALGALGGWPSTTSGGDVVVTVSMGGNDFNNDISTMLLASAAQAKANTLVANYERLIDALRQKYEDQTQGKNLVVIGFTIHDPTDGTGTIPPSFTSGFCGTINRAAAAGPTAISNLDLFNDAIRDVLQRKTSYVADNNQFLRGHGMSSADRWYSNDCAHPNTEGHHQIRRNVWRVITGQMF